MKKGRKQIKKEGRKTTKRNRNKEKEKEGDSNKEQMRIRRAITRWRLGRKKQEKTTRRQK